MAALGSMDWLARSGGRLAWHERLQLVAQGVQAQWQARAQHKGPRKPPRCALQDIVPPDSAIVREAFAMAEDCSPPYLLNHCLRAYYWARLLDEDARPFDDEALFVALLLHDLGLTERWRLPSPSAQCFTRAGARAATELATRHGWSERRAALSAEAIALHLNVVVGASAGKEAQMLRAGSGGDVAGLGLARLGGDTVSAVVARHPRLALKAQMGSLLRQEADAQPCCRLAFLCQRLGFLRLVEGNRVFSE